jgi:hypothetical protein
MRGKFVDQGGLFSYIAPDKRVPANHPLRKIRELVRDVLGELNRSLGKIYASKGRPSIPPEQLLSAAETPRVHLGCRRSIRTGRGPRLLAQEAGRRHRIAILSNTPREGSRRWQAFLDELGHGGFVEGGNLDVDHRGFGVAAPFLEAVAIELTSARPDVIVAAGPEAARAAQHATRSIAIVAIADDLVASGLVASMPHPDGNTTGVATFAFQLNVNRLELLHEALPEAGP